MPDAMMRVLLLCINEKGRRVTGRKIPPCGITECSNNLRRIETSRCFQGPNGILAWKKEGGEDAVGEKFDTWLSSSWHLLPVHMYPSSCGILSICSSEWIQFFIYLGGRKETERFVRSSKWVFRMLWLIRLTLPFLLLLLLLLGADITLTSPCWLTQPLAFPKWEQVRRHTGIGTKYIPSLSWGCPLLPTGILAGCPKCDGGK